MRELLELPGLKGDEPVALSDVDEAGPLLGELGPLPLGSNNEKPSSDSRVAILRLSAGWVMKSFWAASVMEPVSATVRNASIPSSVIIPPCSGGCNYARPCASSPHGRGFDAIVSRTSYIMNYLQYIHWK